MQILGVKPLPALSSSTSSTGAVTVAGSLSITTSGGSSGETEVDEFEKLLGQDSDRTKRRDPTECLLRTEAVTNTCAYILYIFDLYIF